MTIRDIMENISINVSDEELLLTVNKKSNVATLIYDGFKGKNINADGSIMLDDLHMKSSKSIYNGFENMHVVPIDMQVELFSKNPDQITDIDLKNSDVNKALHCCVSRCSKGIFVYDRNVFLSHYILDQLTNGLYYPALSRAIFEYRNIGILLYFNLNFCEIDNNFNTINVCFVNTGDKLILKSIDINNTVNQFLTVPDVMLSIIDKVFIYDSSVFLKSLVGRISNKDIKLQYSDTRFTYIRPYILNNDTLLIENNNYLRHHINKMYKYRISMDKQQNTDGRFFTSLSGYTILSREPNGLCKDYNGDTLQVDYDEVVGNITEIK